MNFRPRLLLALSATLIACALGAPAHAQQILVMVNGDPITTYDVSQMQKLHQLVERKTLSQKDTVEELIEERLKIQQSRRLIVDVDDKDVDRMFANVAQRTGRTPEQLAAGLAQAGLDVKTFKNKLRADYIWGAYVRSKSGAANIREQDVNAALQRAGDTTLISTEYTLRPIIFVVPRRSNLHQSRLQEANAFRNRFTDCEAGVESAKGLKEVVVRPPILRLSSDMPAQVRQIFDKTEVGRLTPPEVSQTGVEMFAVCAKKEVRGESSKKREIKDQLTSKTFEAESKKMMADLRKSALIQYR